jgi:methyl-accepting chemotaxis protein
MLKRWFSRLSLARKLAASGRISLVATLLSALVVVTTLSLVGTHLGELRQRFEIASSATAARGQLGALLPPLRATASGRGVQNGEMTAAKALEKLEGATAALAGRADSDEARAAVVAVKRLMPIARRAAQEVEALAQRRSEAEAAGDLFRAQASGEEAAEWIDDLQRDAAPVAAALTQLESAQRDRVLDAMISGWETLQLVFGGAIVSLLLLTIIAVTLSLAVRRSILRPVLSLTRATERIIEHGDLSVRVEASSPDELGQLGSAFQEMVQRLRAVPIAVGDSARSLDSASHQLSDVGHGVSSAASGMQAGVDQTEAAVEELRASLAQLSQVASIVRTDVKSTVSATGELVRAHGVLDEATGAMDTAAQGTATTTEEMEANLRDLESTAAGVREASNHVSERLDGLAASCRVVATKAATTLDRSITMLSDASAGVTAAEQLVEAVGGIRREVTGSAELAAQVRGRANEASRVIDVLNDLLEEVQLLGLNANIVAAQSKEGGAFSVVAQQIRSLATQLRKSTDEISGWMLELEDGAREASVSAQRSFEAVESGVRVGGSVIKALKTLHESSEKVREAGEQINEQTVLALDGVVSSQTHARELAAAANQIETAVGEQRTAAAWLLDSSSTLAGSSRRLQDLVIAQESVVAQLEASVKSTGEAVVDLEASENAQQEQADDLGDAVKRFAELAEHQATQASELGGCIESVRREARSLMDQVDRFQV